MIAFSPVARASPEPAPLVLRSLIFMLMYLPGTLLSAYHQERYGLRFSLLFGHGLTAVGIAVKYLAGLIPLSAGPARYAVTLMGQTIAAVGQPYFTNMPASIAGNWFPTHQRELATIVASLVNPLGNAAGSAVPGFVVQHPDSILMLTLVLGVIAVALWGVVWMIVMDEPPSPPSAAAAARASLRSESLRSLLTPSASPDAPGGSPSLCSSPPAPTQLSQGEDLAELKDFTPIQRLWAETSTLLGNGNFRVLAFGFGVGLGIFNAFLTLIAQILRPCGYESGTAGVAGAVLIGCGLVGAAIVGPVLEATKAYVPLLKGGIVACLAGVLFTLLCLTPGKQGLLIAAFAVMGFCMLPLLPLVLENAAEMAYPIPEEGAAAVLMNIGQIAGITCTLIIQHTIPPTCDTVFKPSSIFVFCVLVMAASVIMFFKPEYKRQAAEASHRETTAPLPKQVPGFVKLSSPPSTA